MKYYLISNSAEEKEVGCYPQTSGLFEGYDHGAPNAMENLTSDEFPDFVPDLRFELDEEAILTDIISPSNLDFATGLLMNAKAKQIFDTARICPHKYYDASLKVETTTLTYHWLHLVNPSFKDIDFPKSHFVELLPGNKKTEHSFNKESEFEKVYSSTTNPVRAQKIILIESAKNENYDLFFFPFIHSGLIASEQLCQELKKANITGLKFDEQAFI